MLWNKTQTLLLQCWGQEDLFLWPLPTLQCLFLCTGNFYQWSQGMWADTTSVLDVSAGKSLTSSLCSPIIHIKETEKMSEGREQHSNSLSFSSFRHGRLEEWIQCSEEPNMLWEIKWNTLAHIHLHLIQTSFPFLFSWIIPLNFISKSVFWQKKHQKHT